MNILIYGTPTYNLIINDTNIENLRPLQGECNGKKVAFLVQYGFLEAVHARPLERYLEHISNLLCCSYLGTIIKGGCDGLTENAKGSKKTLTGIYEIGKVFGATGHLDKRQLDEYSAPETQKKQNKFLLRILMKILNKVYWEKSLEKNGFSYKQSFAKPYGD